MSLISVEILSEESIRENMREGCRLDSPLLREEDTIMSNAICPSATSRCCQIYQTSNHVLFWVYPDAKQSHVAL